jgi:hypothetical protein
MEGLVSRLHALFVAALLVAACAGRPEPSPTDNRNDLLAASARGPAPWKLFPAEAQQRQPVYLGSSPLDMVLDGAATGVPSLPESLRILGEREIPAALSGVERRGEIEVEAWPVLDDHGRPTWAIARWRKDAGSPWIWIDRGASRDEGDAAHDPIVLLPFTLDPVNGSDRALIFDDFLTFADLYVQPRFGECVWTDRGEGRVLDAWLPPDGAAGYARDEATRGDRLCRVVPQPARLDAKPVTLVLRVDGAAIEWPPEIRWLKPPARPGIPAGDAEIKAWPDDAEEAFRRDIAILSGQEEAVFPRSGRSARFHRKSCALPDNDILDVVAYLEERYAALGIATQRHEFSWRGIPQADLVAILPGTAPDAEDRPVVLSDHIDTAFAEDVFAKSGARLPVPGADDNGSATATLLLAARALAHVPHRHDVWLVHLTGEEYPSDDLGARELVKELLREKRRLGGVVQLDMIGWRKAGDPVFQVSAGGGPDAATLGALAVAAASTAAPELEPELRLPGDPRSYLYNTDGQTFSEIGFPAILINEHLNGLENIDRHGYHETTDLPSLVDVGYALAVAKVAIETVARRAAR